MSEFHDPELRQELGRLSGSYPDSNVAYASWQRRVGQARRRRAVAWTSGVAMSLLFGTVAVAALHNPRTGTLVPGKSADSVESVARVATTEVAESTTPEVSEPETTVTAAAPLETTASTEVESSLPEATDAVGAESGSGSGSTTKKSGGHTGSGTTTAPAQTPAAPPVAPVSATQTFSSIGGSVTVRQDGDRIKVVALNPAAGFEVDGNDDSDHGVKVSFKGPDHSSQISVSLNNGTLSHKVTEHDKSQESQQPDNTSGDHGGSNG
jgi:hypothetical protein